MGKLNQVLAVVAGKKTHSQNAITEVYHKLQKEALLTGIARTYRPKAEDGDQLPPESKRVQYSVGNALETVRDVLTDLFDVVATQEHANTKAKADVVLEEDGQVTVLLQDVPVSYLLFLEKQLVDIGTMVGKLPTLDPGQVWHFDDNQNCFATSPTERVLTRKVYRNHVKAPATEHHPAQVEVYTEEALIGYWSTINYSGAITERTKARFQERVRQLQEAVKKAREQANSIDVENVSVGRRVFSYLFPSGEDTE